MAEKKPIPYGTLLLFVFWAVLITAVYFWMSSGKTVSPELRSVLRPEPKPLQSFELTDQYQQAFNLERLQGKWSLVFFGYTYCPDICPTTLSTLTAVSRLLKTGEPQDMPDMQVVFVSVDPQRDTPDVIEKYLKYFDESFQGITGAQQDVDSLARQFGAGHMKEQETAPGQYLVSHTSSIFLVDPRGRLLAAFAPPHDPDTIVDLFRQIHSLY